MLNFEDVSSTVWFDIETAPFVNSWDELVSSYPHLADIWRRKTHLKYAKDFNDPRESFESNAGLHPEYAKVIAVTFGKVKLPSISNWEDTNTYITKDIYNTDESELLRQCIKAFSSGILGGFNIQGFDIPFLAKRYLINGIRVPDALILYNKKPWEIKVLDLMNVWKNGSYDNISLELLCEVLNIETSKGELQGATVYEQYRKGVVTIKDISDYCNRDVMVTMQVAQKLCFNN